jgi:hypothetical protein
LPAVGRHAAPGSTPLGSDRRADGRTGAESDPDSADAADLLDPLGPMDPLDPLHPWMRHRAALAPPGVVLGAGADLPTVPPRDPTAAPPAAAPDVASAHAGPPSVEDLLPALVRRVSWTGDRRTGSVRLELAAGELAGGTLLVHAQDGCVRVHLDVPPGADRATWHERLRRRLEARHVVVDTLEVT